MISSRKWNLGTLFRSWVTSVQVCSSAGSRAAPLTHAGCSQHPPQFFAINKNIPDCIYGQNCGPSKETSHLAKCLYNTNYKTISLRRTLDFPAKLTQRPHKTGRQLQSLSLKSKDVSAAHFNALMVVSNAAFHLAHPVSTLLN